MSRKSAKKKNNKKPKKKISAAQKKARAERQQNYDWVFMNGKQVRIKREPTIDGIPKDEWIYDNADQFFCISTKCGSPSNRPSSCGVRRNKWMRDRLRCSCHSTWKIE